MAGRTQQQKSYTEFRVIIMLTYVFITSPIPIDPAFKNPPEQSVYMGIQVNNTTPSFPVANYERYTVKTTKPDGQAQKHQGIWFCFLPYYITSLWRVQIKAAPQILQDPCGAHTIPLLTKHTQSLCTSLNYAIHRFLTVFDKKMSILVWNICAKETQL